MIYVRDLSLDNVSNIRDLGGYSTIYRKAIKFGRFIRSGVVTNLTENEMSYLLDYGVKTVIDLREKDELELKPNAFNGIASVDYYGVSLMKFYAQELSAKDKLVLLSSEDDIYYLEIINNFYSMHGVFNIMAESKPGAILFNCTIGMHRTGIISALLLMLAECTLDDVEIDYSIPYTTVNELIKIEKMKDYNFPKHLLKISQTMNYIRIKYGSVVNYLKDIGVSEKKIANLKNRLLGP